MRTSSIQCLNRNGLVVPFISACFLLLGLGNTAHAGLEAQWGTAPESPILVGAITSGAVTANFVPDTSSVGEEEAVTDQTVNYTYSWSAGGGGTCTPANGASALISYSSKGDKIVSVTITATGSYTIKDSETGSTRSVTINETTSLTANIQVIELTIEVKRSGTNSWRSSADIAAGGKSSNVHKADLKVKLDPTPSSAIDVEISVSGTGAGGGAPGTLKSAFSLGTISISGVGGETASLSAAETTGTFASSNKIDDITLSAGDQSVTVHQKWDYKTDDAGWDYDEYFEYDEPIDIALTIELESDTGIDKHDLKFEVTEVSYDQLNLNTWNWDEVTGVTTNLDQYAEFEDDGEATTNSDGTAETKLTVNAYPGGDWKIMVYEVYFDAADTSVVE